MCVARCLQPEKNQNRAHWSPTFPYSLSIPWKKIHGTRLWKETGIKQNKGSNSLKKNEINAFITILFIQMLDNPSPIIGLVLRTRPYVVLRSVGIQPRKKSMYKVNEKRVKSYALRAFSWARCSRADRTRGDNCPRSTHSFIKSCYVSTLAVAPSLPVVRGTHS